MDTVFFSQPLNWVAPFVGAWIEILLPIYRIFHAVSLPSWERGLKSVDLIGALATCVVAPFVGAWIEIVAVAKGIKTWYVAPFVGAWIEIFIHKVVI